MFAQYGEPGIDVYADFLVERERFAEWAALMHRYGVSYDGAEAGGLKLALTTDPAAVLPLLHTYAMSFINEKNRQSYRRAVKLFKKMKAGSKKSGKTDFWNRYIDTVREKNRRLRALDGRNGEREFELMNETFTLKRLFRMGIHLTEDGLFSIAAEDNKWLDSRSR